jgi:hypothetical protein
MSPFLSQPTIQHIVLCYAENVQKALLNLSPVTPGCSLLWEKATIKNSCSGLLVDLHDERGPGEEGSAAGGGRCGQINVEAVQQVLAAKWAVDVINNQSLPHELSIGQYHIEIDRMQCQMSLSKTFDL